MRSGDLDEQITLQSVESVNNGGELELRTTDVATVWAKVISERGQEGFESARTNARSTVKLQLRFRADVTTEWRILWDGQQYEIVYADRSLRRHGELWLTARVVGAE